MSRQHFAPRKCLGVMLLWSFQGEYMQIVHKSHWRPSAHDKYSSWRELRHTFAKMSLHVQMNHTHAGTDLRELQPSVEHLRLRRLVWLSSLCLQISTCRCILEKVHLVTRMHGRMRASPASDAARWIYKGLHVLTVYSQIPCFRLYRALFFACQQILQILVCIYSCARRVICMRACECAFDCTSTKCTTNTRTQGVPTVMPCSTRMCVFFFSFLFTGCSTMHVIPQRQTTLVCGSLLQTCANFCVRYSTNLQNVDMLSHLWQVCVLCISVFRGAHTPGTTRVLV